MHAISHPYRQSVHHVFLHICMKLELVRLESNRKVALGDSVPAGLKRHLVTGEPAFVAHHSCTVDGCTIDVVVDVTAEVDVVALVARLDLAAFLAVGRQNRSLKFSVVPTGHLFSLCHVFSSCITSWRQPVHTGKEFKTTVYSTYRIVRDKRSCRFHCPKGPVLTFALKVLKEILDPSPFHQTL